MTQKDKKENKEELVKDPVCGMVKSVGDMKTKVEYKGKIYYFCTDGDKEMFEAFPDNWVPKKDRKEISDV